MLVQEKGATIYCSAGHGGGCGKSFPADRIKVETEKLTGKRIGHFFRCPFCGMKYPFVSITEKGQSLLPLLKKKQKTVKDVTGDKRRYRDAVLDYKRVLKKYQAEVGGAYSEEEVMKSD